MQSGWLPEHCCSFLDTIRLTDRGSRNFSGLLLGAVRRVCVMGIPRRVAVALRGRAARLHLISPLHLLRCALRARGLDLAASCGVGAGKSRA